MPEHLKALVVILVLAGASFAFARPLASAIAGSAEDFARRRNLWFAITLAAFLAHSFWIFIAFAAALLVFALPQERNKLALFFLVLFAVPAITAEIPGLGIMEHFFIISYPRLLALAVLLPVYLSLRTQPGIEAFGRWLPDKLLAGYLVLNFVLLLPHDGVNGAMRSGLFYPFIDVFLPYYVASRSLRSLCDFRDALMAFVVAALVLSAIALFEFVRHWMLYVPLEDALGVSWGLGMYLPRGEFVRAQASTGQPIPLGYTIAVALGFFLYLARWMPSDRARRLWLAALAAGLIAPLSRGPWLGAAALVLVFIATGPSAGLQLARLALLGLVILPVLLVLPAGQAILDYLPFVGTVDEGGVVYRQLLLDTSLELIAQSPFLGDRAFMQSPAMQALRQGQGIIDIVNSYLGVALESGLVGLALFAGCFIAVGAGIFSAMRSLADKQAELYLLGRALLATLVGILVIISTVSSISIIPVVYWAVAGLGVAYARMLALAHSAEVAARPVTVNA